VPSFAFLFDGHARSVSAAASLAALFFLFLFFLLHRQPNFPKMCLMHFNA
jgi:hypothetical protein